MVLENILSFIPCLFLSIQLLCELLYPFHLTCSLWPFFSLLLFNSKLFLIYFLQFFFVKQSNNFFLIKIANNKCPRYSILYVLLILFTMSSNLSICTFFETAVMYLQILFFKVLIKRLAIK